MFQTSWFIAQCIARGHWQQQLALTELELVTLALASLNATTFAIWWHKPIGVQEPVKIYLKTKGRNVDDVAPQVSVEDKSFHHSFGDLISRAWKDIKETASDVLHILRNPGECRYGVLQGLLLYLPIDIVYIVSFPFLVVFPFGIVMFLRIIETQPVSQLEEPSGSRGLLAARIVASLQRFRYQLSSAVANFVGGRLEVIFVIDDALLPFLFGWFVLLPSLFFLLLLFVLFLALFLTLLILVSFISNAVFGIVSTSTVQSGASHVPSFYAPTTKSDRWSRMVVFALFGVTFGGLHCIGWSFAYPTHPEQTLWRTTSLTITVIPLIVAPIDFLLSTRLRNRDINSCEKFERTALLILDLTMTILLFIYVPARLSLIAQALALLRYEPPTALVPVDWSKYAPHFFSH